jgi:hypothetical protein
LAGASARFVQRTPTHPLQTGLKGVVELTAYPDGKFSVSVSRLGGTPRRRTVSIADTMMLNDADEAKDHTDAIIDFLARLSAAAGAAAGQGTGGGLGPNQQPPTP